MRGYFLKFFCILLFTLPVFAKNTILVMGDSLSSGYGMPVASGWVMLLQQQLQRDGCNDLIVNASIPGDTSSNGLSRLPPLLKTHRPYLTVLELGGNDGLRGLDLMVLKKNLQNSIDLLLQEKSRVLLVGLTLPDNYGELYVQGFRKVYADLHRRYPEKVIFLDNIFLGLNKQAHLQEDGIHPNRSAQIIIQKHLWNAIKPFLKCKV